MLTQASISELPQYPDLGYCQAIKTAHRVLQVDSSAEMVAFEHTPATECFSPPKRMTEEETLIREARALLAQKAKLNAIEAEYEDQRRKVRRILDARQEESCTVDGFEIKKVEDRTIRKFDVELLKEELRYHYMGEGEIERVIQNSKDFVTQEGVLRIRPVRPNQA